MASAGALAGQQLREWIATAVEHDLAEQSAYLLGRTRSLGTGSVTSYGFDPRDVVVPMPTGR
jgi:hypothetical protein